MCVYMYIYIHHIHVHTLQLLSFYSAVARNDYANVTTEIEEGNCTLTVECLIEGVDEFWITVNQSGTTVLTRRLIDCNTPALMMIEELPMLPGNFNFEIEVVIGEDIKVTLLGRFEGSK